MKTFALAQWLNSRIRLSISGVVPVCKDITRTLSQSMDRTLPLGTRIKMRFHMLFCVYCRRYEKHLKYIRVAVRGLADHANEISSAKLPADAKARMKAALQKESK